MKKGHQYIKFHTYSIRNIPFCMLHCPNNRIHHKLLVLRWNVEKGLEAVRVHGLEK